MSRTSSSKPFVYTSQTPSGHNIAFTSVHAGSLSLTVPGGSQGSAQAAQNRWRVEASLGIPPGTTHFVSQNHSTQVLETNGTGWGTQETLGEGDAIVSQDGTASMAIMVADCLPIAITTDYGPTAIVHAGRVGLLNGILQQTVQQLRSYGSGTVTATIGPSICGDCYEVPHEMQAEAAQHHPRIAARTRWGTPSLDLQAAAEDILEADDVVVHRVDQCTYTNTELFSHRRQPGQGRIAGFVWKAPKTC